MNVTTSGSEFDKILVLIFEVFNLRVMSQKFRLSSYLVY
jgi:uncharacterized protein YhhL (DUF1145 family)